MNASPNTKVSKAMIFAAGLGTRYKPWTDLHPKALAPVNGKSLLQRNIEYLQGFGIYDLVVNVHHFADQITGTIRAKDGWGSKIVISDETDQVLETGGGLMKARHWLEDGPFIAMNVDILTDLDLHGLIRDHFLRRPLATLAVTDRSTSRYFLFDEDSRLCGWRNVLTGQERLTGRGGEPEILRGSPSAAQQPGNKGSQLTQKAFSGIHLIEPALLSLVRQEGKFSTVDMYLDLGGEHTIRGFDHSGGRLIDVGKPEAAEKAAVMFPL